MRGGMMDSVEDGIGNIKKNFPKKLALLGIILLLLVITVTMSVGINDAGHRTLVQYPNGTMKIKFAPGWYTTWFGTATVYNDVITIDFDKTDAQGEDATLDQKGIAVRYQDGGTGTIYGKARFSLPVDDPTMLSLHKDFRSNNGVAYKLIKAVTEEGQNLTAGLMSSEDAYATKRGIFTQWSHEQIANGKFQTELKETTEEDEVTGKKLVKVIPEIKYGPDGRPLQFESDLKKYGVSMTGYQITDWDFEEKTLHQIQAKREATMAIITAKANAERAKQDALTAEEQGKANTATAKWEQEVIKAREVTKAQQELEVARLQTEKATEYKRRMILEGEGEAEKKKLIMNADGALELKLAAYVEVQKFGYQELGKQKWVPEIQLTSGAGSTANGGSQVVDFMRILETKALSDLGLDMSVTKGRTTQQK